MHFRLHNIIIACYHVESQSIEFVIFYVFEHAVEENRSIKENCADVRVENPELIEPVQNHSDIGLGMWIFKFIVGASKLRSVPRQIELKIVWNVLRIIEQQQPTRCELINCHTDDTPLRFKSY